MAKSKRNEPCPCGSGKKYKKCCLHQMEADAIARRKTEDPEVESPDDQMAAVSADPDELDDLSNSVLDLIDKKKWEEAKKVCNDLLVGYPDQVDGLERLAMVYKAMGEKEKAIEYYEKSAEFAKNHDGFDSELIEMMLDEAKALKG